MRDFRLGYGERRLLGGHNGRYYYAENVDCSIGAAMKGPTLTSVTPATRDTANGIDRFFEIGGRILALNGRYCLYRDTLAVPGLADATWSVSKDFGASKVATDVTVAKGNYSGSTRYAFVGMGDSTLLWYYDATSATGTWTQHPSLYARQFAVTAEEFYRVDDTNAVNILPLGSDPLVASNWTTPVDDIGTKDHGVVRIGVDAAGAVLFLKEDDIYTLSEDGTTHRLFHGQFPASSTNGEAFGRWKNQAYIVYGRSTFRLEANGKLTQVGPELIHDNNSAIRGYITAFCGTDYHLYAAIYNPDSSINSSYLLKFEEDFTKDAQGRDVPVWHGSITAAFTGGLKITAMHQSVIGADTGHQRMWLGMSDGTIRYFPLPCTKNPAACSSYKFSTETGTLYLPRLHCNFPSERKSFLSVSVESDVLSSTNYASASWRTDPGGSFTLLAGNFDQAPSERIALPSSTSGVSLDLSLELTSSATSSTPTITGVTVLYLVRPLPLEIHEINIIADDGVRRRDGTPYRKGALEIRGELDILSTFAGGFSWIAPDEQTHTVVVVPGGVQRAVAYDVGSRAPRQALQVRLAETVSNETRGTLVNLQSYTLAQLEAFTLSEMESL